MAIVELKRYRALTERLLRREADVSRTFRTTWLALALILALALPLLWFSLIAAPTIRVEVGMPGDETYLSGFNEPEKNSTETFRWTGGAAELRLPNLSSRYQELRIHAHGWRPAGVKSPVVQIDLAGRPWTGYPNPARSADLPRAAAARCRQPNDRCRLCDAGLLHAERRPRAGLRAGLAGAARAGSFGRPEPSGSSAVRRCCWGWRCCCWGYWRCPGAGRWQPQHYWRPR